MDNNVKNSATKHCESRAIVNFLKGETILTIGDHNGKIGVLQEGNAHISYMDRQGHEAILEVLSSGDCFGEYLFIPSTKQLYYVIADENCTVMFINFANVVSHCDRNCQNHANLVKDLLLLTSQRAQSLSTHVSILSQHTTKDKILTYLNQLRQEYNNDSFYLPITLVQLADYLGVDRAAMMREIKRLNDDGVIISSKRNFKLLQDTD